MLRFLWEISQAIIFWESSGQLLLDHRILWIFIKSCLDLKLNFHVTLREQHQYHWNSTHVLTFSSPRCSHEPICWKEKFPYLRSILRKLINGTSPEKKNRKINIKILSYLLSYWGWVRSAQCSLKGINKRALKPITVN